MKKYPFDLKRIREIEKQYPTPFYLYDEEGIKERAKKVQQAFAWNEGYREYFAVKATPTPAILRLLHEMGCGLDCASKTELVLAQRCGVKGREIMFTSNQTQDEDYKEALNAGAIINLDAYEQIDNLINVLKITGQSMPQTICLRYNPGKFSIDASYIGELDQSKFGMRKDQLIQAIKELHELGVCHFGIHAMLAGNSLIEDYYPLLAEEVFRLAVEVKNETGVSINLIDLAGGIGIPYHEEEREIDILSVGKKVQEVYDRVLVPNRIYPSLCTEMGRFITGPCGYLVTSVVGKKETYRKYIGVNASMADLMRPGMYGSYHHIEILQENKGKEDTFDVVGPICENNDKFAINRLLPTPQLNDIVVIEDAGAHGHSMGFNYNGRLRCAELLFKENGSVQLIRRKQTVEDYFATLDIDTQFCGKFLF